MAVEGSALAAAGRPQCKAPRSSNHQILIVPRHNPVHAGERRPEMAARESIRVRPANRHDVPDIADLLHSMGWFAHINREPQLETEARITSQLALNNEYGDHTVLIAELVNARGASHLAAYLNA